MNRQEFIDVLSARLAALPPKERDKSVDYYTEIIADRMEDGMSEGEAVAALGDMEEIVRSIMYDMSIPRLMKAKMDESRSKSPNKALWLTLVIIGFPLWLPLLAAFGVVMLAVYVTVWALIISLCAVVLSLATACAMGIFAGVSVIIWRSLPVGICVLGMSIVCGALAIFMIKPVFLIIKALIRFTTFILRRIKSIFIREADKKSA